MGSIEAACISKIKLGMGTCDMDDHVVCINFV